MINGCPRTGRRQWKRRAGGGPRASQRPPFRLAHAGGVGRDRPPCPPPAVPAWAGILQQEDTGTVACFILSGATDVLLESEDGRQFIVARLGPGDHFGEMSLLDGEPRSATVVATSDTELLLIQRDEFLQELEENPRVMRQMLVALSRRLREADAQVAAVAFGDSAARLARLLVQNARPAPGGAEVHAVQEQLAAMTGTTRQTVGRIFGEWRRAGYIRTGRRSTVLLRPEALEAIVRDRGGQ